MGISKEGCSFERLSLNILTVPNIVKISMTKKPITVDRFRLFTASLS